MLSCRFQGMYSTDQPSAVIELFILTTFFFFMYFVSGTIYIVITITSISRTATSCILQIELNTLLEENGRQGNSN
jgi:hypothetical protein